MTVLIAFIKKLGPEILQGTGEHIYLTLLAIGIAVGIALPLGIILTRCKAQKLVSAVMGAAGVFQTIPSLALISFIVVLFTALRFFAGITLPTIGPVPAVIALVLYALLPILRNTYTGIRQVDAAVIDVAKGMGTTDGQILLRVELPLSLSVIMTGVRISIVWTIGVATLCGLIGAGGLGTLIIKGLRSIQLDYMLAGTIPAAGLALLFDGTMELLERWLMPGGLRIQEK